jgi:hypothetical protein
VIDALAQVDLSSLSQCPTEILEISISRHVGSDEQEIVVIRSSEPRGAPVQMAFALSATDTEIARIVWVGAAKFD